MDNYGGGQASASSGANIGEPQEQALDYIDEVGCIEQAGNAAESGAQAPPEYRPEPEEIVQVVYQSNQNGAFVGVESSLLEPVGIYANNNEDQFQSHHHHQQQQADYKPSSSASDDSQAPFLQDDEATNGAALNVLPLVRAASTLPSVAEESSSGGATNGQTQGYHQANEDGDRSQHLLNADDQTTSRSISRSNEDFPEVVGLEQQQNLDSSVYADDGSHYNGASSQLYTNEDPGQQITISNNNNNNSNYFAGQQQQAISTNPNAIYSTINRQRTNAPTDLENAANYEPTDDELTLVNPTNETRPLFGAQLSHSFEADRSSIYSNPVYNQLNTSLSADQKTVESCNQDYVGETDSHSTIQTKRSNISELHEDELHHSSRDTLQVSGAITAAGGGDNEQNESLENDLPEKENQFGDSNGNDHDDDLSHILTRHKQGAAESGSFRINFRKKLGISVSTNENDLTAHRQKLLESTQQHTNIANAISADEAAEQASDLPKFKRNHSVSFNVGSNRSGRHSVDIRNLPSYLTVKRASIVDVARGAMSSLMHSFASGGGSSSASGIGSISKRDSSPDDGEPIFEEPIAPTLSLGQRVALVKNNGAEFGTVGWIGQLPDVDYDWMVGVIFDNMIGNSDGAYQGVRYFYSRENYAMFVPLSSLTKTDNYIGRPETGTMLSRMSVSLKPGQLISIQRSTIRLQHCFLNAPHQRVGHDVRAVSNRLHCQCHNCGPCAHLTKQNRISALPAFGAHHAPNKKNSLAHAAVEILAHHHHHYHEEEHSHEEDYQFGDNSAHACNFVRYSCCQQNGIGGHNFSADCDMVRPELLDNLIHAPRAPHRRPRLRRSRQSRAAAKQAQLQHRLRGYDNRGAELSDSLNLPALEAPATGTIKSLVSTTGSEEAAIDQDGEDNGDDHSSYSSSYSSSRSSSLVESVNLELHEPSTGRPFAQDSIGQTSVYQGVSVNTNYQDDSSATYYQTGTNMFNTIDSRMSILEQQRFIYQREASPYFHSQQSDNSSGYRAHGSLGSSIRRCFACLMGRKSHHRRPKKKKRKKQSTRNRMIEYRRKQSTFVPSTLAKPHEDFASHGIFLPSASNQTNLGLDDVNSDYSSYSKSTGSSSSSSSPDHHYRPADGEAFRAEIVAENVPQQHESMTIEQNGISYEQQLKSTWSFQGGGKQTDNDKSVNNNNSTSINNSNSCEDYTFSDGYGSYKKNGFSHDSASTDLGYIDTWNSNSNDTLKQIVDQTINEQVDLPEPILAEQWNYILSSPIQSSSASNLNEQIDISSPTISAVDDHERTDELCNGMERLDFGDQRPDESHDQ